MMREEFVKVQRPKGFPGENVCGIFPGHFGLPSIESVEVSPKRIPGARGCRGVQSSAISLSESGR